MSGLQKGSVSLQDKISKSFEYLTLFNQLSVDREYGTITKQLRRVRPRQERHERW